MMTQDETHDTTSSGPTGVILMAMFASAAVWVYFLVNGITLR